MEHYLDTIQTLDYLLRDAYIVGFNTYIFPTLLFSPTERNIEETTCDCSIVATGTLEHIAHNKRTVVTWDDTSSLAFVVQQLVEIPIEHVVVDSVTYDLQLHFQDGQQVIIYVDEETDQGWLCEQTIGSVLYRMHGRNGLLTYEASPFDFQDGARFQMKLELTSNTQPVDIGQCAMLLPILSPRSYSKGERRPEMMAKQTKLVIEAAPSHKTDGSTSLQQFVDTLQEYRDALEQIQLYYKLQARLEVRIAARGYSTTKLTLTPEAHAFLAKHAIELAIQII